MQFRRKANQGGPRSQDQLATALDVTRTSVSNIERGKHRVFLDQVYLAARALGVPVTDLLPPMEAIFPPVPVVLQANADVTENSFRKVSEIALSYQRADADQRATGKTQTRKRR